DENRLKRLDTQTVQRRSSIEQHGMLANDVLKNVPDHGVLLLDHFLGLLDGGAVALGLELVIDERLEQLESHLLGQTALVEFQLRTNHDDRSAGVVHPLAQEVLAETALLAFEGVGQRLQRAVVGSAQHAATAPIVKQGVDRFLQHALFVAHDYIGSAQLHE